jgi:formamidopyrimidine-DNA glycosylase
VPELPEVEHYRRFFAEHAVGRTVVGVWADPTILRNTTPRALRAGLTGRTFAEPGRHGKWLVAPTNGPSTLLVHFGMTGDLLWSPDRADAHRHDRMRLAFEGGGELVYRNLRKLGGVWLAKADEVGEVLGRLGPDALGLGRRAFLARLATRRGQVKAALLDQSFVAGIGNLIADEALWQARLHPRRRIDSLTPEEADRLHDRLQRVLRAAVASDDYLEDRRGWLSHVRGRPGAACPRCGTPLERMVAGGRTTYLCPSCQPEA